MLRFVGGGDCEIKPSGETDLMTLARHRASLLLGQLRLVKQHRREMLPSGSVASPSRQSCPGESSSDASADDTNGASSADNDLIVGFKKRTADEREGQSASSASSYEDFENFMAVKSEDQLDQTSAASPPSTPSSPPPPEQSKAGDSTNKGKGGSADADAAIVIERLSFASPPSPRKRTSKNVAIVIEPTSSSSPSSSCPSTPRKRTGVKKLVRLWSSRHEGKR